MASERKERIALNETLFRTANERMSGWEEQHARRATEIYYCECAAVDCRERVELGKDDYERVRASSRTFVVVPGHEIEDVETVVERHNDWLIIEKPDEVGAIVDASDPRGDG